MSLAVESKKKKVRLKTGNLRKYTLCLQAMIDIFREIAVERERPFPASPTLINPNVW